MIDVAPVRPFAFRLADWRHPRALVAPAVRLRDERPDDVPAREALLDASFGSARFAKTCERLREGRHAAAGLSFVAMRGRALVGTLRFWHVEAGDREALMLGPLAVCPTQRSAGIGSTLIDHGLRQARRLGHESVILVGDAPYYARFGFDRALVAGLTLPGPVEAERFLGLELVPGALQGATGRVVGTGLFLDAHRGPDWTLAA